MATVEDLLAKKGRIVHCIAPGETVLAATQAMNRDQIGALVVRDGPRLVGIFTERDVLRRVVAEERDPKLTRVEEVMTRDIAVAACDTELDEVAGVMKHRRIRHLPVVTDHGELVGIVSIGDLNAWEADGHETTIRWLSEYIQGRV